MPYCRRHRRARSFGQPRRLMTGSGPRTCTRARRGPLPVFLCPTAGSSGGAGAGDAGVAGSSDRSRTPECARSPARRRLGLGRPSAATQFSARVLQTACSPDQRFVLVMLIAAYAAMGIETTTLCSNEPHVARPSGAAGSTPPALLERPHSARPKATPRLAEVALLEFEAGRVKTAV
jgi:hypothetical protein